MTEPQVRGTDRNPRQMLGKLLGRHHRSMVIGGEYCAACHNYSPTVKELRDSLDAALRDQTRITVEPLREALLNILDAWDRRSTNKPIEQIQALIPAIIEARAALAAVPPAPGPGEEDEDER